MQFVISYKLPCRIVRQRIVRDNCIRTENTAVSTCCNLNRTIESLEPRQRKHRYVQFRSVDRSKTDLIRFRYALLYFQRFRNNAVVLQNCSIGKCQFKCFKSTAVKSKDFRICNSFHVEPPFLILNKLKRNRIILNRIFSCRNISNRILDIRNIEVTCLIVVQIRAVIPQTDFLFLLA